MTNCCIISVLTTSNYFFGKSDTVLRVSYYLAQSPTFIDDMITYDGWFCLPVCRQMWEILFKAVSMFAPKQQGYRFDSCCLCGVWEEPADRIPNTSYYLKQNNCVNVGTESTAVAGESRTPALDTRG